MVLDSHSRTVMNEEGTCWEEDLKMYSDAFIVVANRFPDSGNITDMVLKYNKDPPFCLGFHTDLPRVSCLLLFLRSGRPHGGLRAHPRAHNHTSHTHTCTYI